MKWTLEGPYLPPRGAALIGARTGRRPAGMKAWEKPIKARANRAKNPYFMITITCRDTKGGENKVRWVGREVWGDTPTTLFCPCYIRRMLHCYTDWSVWGAEEAIPCIENMGRDRGYQLKCLVVGFRSPPRPPSLTLLKIVKGVKADKEQKSLCQKGGAGSQKKGEEKPTAQFDLARSQ